MNLKVRPKAGRRAKEDPRDTGQTELFGLIWRPFNDPLRLRAGDVIRFSDRTRWIIRQGVNVVVIIFLSALLKLGLDYLDIVANQTSTGAEINMRIPWAGIPARRGCTAGVSRLALPLHLVVTRV